MRDALKGKVPLLVILILCLWRVLWSFDGLLGQLINPEESHLHFVRWLDKSMLIVMSIGCMVATLRGRRSAISWALWGLLADMLAQGTRRFLEDPAMVLPFLAWAAIIYLLYRIMPAPEIGRKRSDVVMGIKITLAMFVALEAISGLLIRNFYQEIYDPPDPVVKSDRPIVPGLPTFATIGSSPATVDRINNMPFTRLLAERYEGRFNFLLYRKGGLASHRLVRIAHDLMESDLRPDALILYAGHQDYNVAPGLAFLRDFDLFEEGMVPIFETLVRESSLVRLSLYMMWIAQRRYQPQRSPERRQEVFEEYAANIDKIITEAGRKGLHVFAVTVQADKGRLNEESLAYMALENGYIRELPKRFTHVTLVDFEPVLDKLYPNGPKQDCEPYEPDPVAGGCGDPFHLGPMGHKILADLIGPVLESWASAREVR